MTRAIFAVRLGVRIAWWAPTITIMVIMVVKDALIAAGFRYRLRRVERLIVARRAIEAERVLLAVRRDHDATEQRIMR